MHESAAPEACPVPRPPGLAGDAAFARLLIDSHRRFVGRALVDEGALDRPLAAWLYEAAPFCLLAHDPSGDPRFTYANVPAQACFGYGWDEFMRLPSRLSAEAPDRSERQRVMEAVARDGFIAGYRGIRVAKSGRRFWIEQAVVWELVDPSGARQGQAAVFRRWRDVAG